MSLYTFLKFLHVLLAIIAVGFNASYGIWVARAAREPEHELHVLRGIKTLDDRFANPAYALILVTGFAMVAVGDVSLGQFWLITSIVLFVAVAVVGLLVYTPILRRQNELVVGNQVASSEYQALAKRGAIVGGILGAMTVVIVFLMVTKPLS
jgi:uncharacterized membrane protein